MIMMVENSIVGVLCDGNNDIVKCEQNVLDLTKTVCSAEVHMLLMAAERSCYDL